MDIGYIILGMNLIYVSIVSFIYFVKQKVDNIETKIFTSLIISNLLGMVLEFLCGFLIKGLPKYALLTSIVNKLHIANICYWITAFTIYVIIICFNFQNIEQKIKGKKLNIIIPIYICLLGIISFILPLNYFNDGNYIYSYGMGANYIVILCIIYLIIDIFSVIKNVKHLSKFKLLPLITLIIGYIIVFIVRSINPGLVLITTVFSVVTVVMYFTIGNFDLKLINELEIAKDQADKANSAKTEFLSSMSHEIRTPLNAIVGFSDYIMTSDSLEEVKDNAKNILEASNTLLEIVNGILDISKIEAGKLEIINSKYNARDVYGSIYKLIAPKMKEKGLEFDYYIASDVPDTLYGDHANIKKVITEIINNAYKYTDMGFVRYKVNCKNSGDISQLIITVEDSGRGIRHENVNKIFNKFERLEQDRNTTIEGTGLGLSLTKQLVSLMGGEVLVDTTFGAGTKFTIILNQKIETTPVEQPKEIITALDLTDKNILIVDDNMLNIKVTKKLLERYNATNIIYTTNGYDCVEKIKRGAVFDIIFLDDMMPKISGIETFKLLKQIPNFNQPVIIFTANAIAGMRERYLSEGFTDYLAKPIEKDELIRICSSIIYKDGVPASLATPVQKVAQVQPITSVEPTTTVQQISEIELIQPIIPMTPPAPQQTEELEIIGAEEPSSTKEEYLKSNGVALDKALELLGDIEMYNMTIGDFLSEVEEKWQNIINYKNINDMKNYAIEVHSLKSDAKYLGFMPLADIAYQHELKSKEENIAFVNEHFSELQIEYSKALEIAKNYNKMIN